MKRLVTKESLYKDDGTKIMITYNGNSASGIYEYRIEDDVLIIKDSFGNEVRYVK